MSGDILLPASVPINPSPFCPPPPPHKYQRVYSEVRLATRKKLGNGHISVEPGHRLFQHATHSSIICWNDADRLRQRQNATWAAWEIPLMKNIKQSNCECWSLKGKKKLLQSASRCHLCFLHHGDHCFNSYRLTVQISDGAWNKAYGEKMELWNCAFTLRLIILPLTVNLRKALTNTVIHHCSLSHLIMSLKQWIFFFSKAKKQQPINTFWGLLPFPESWKRGTRELVVKCNKCLAAGVTP